MTLPWEALGRSILELNEPEGGELRTVIDIVENGRGGEITQLGAWQGDHQYQRLFPGRLSINQPIYVIAGGSPPTKFQVSFKYRMFGFGQEPGDAVPQHTLQLGYTQRSLWNNQGPFYDTSYMPELIYQWRVNRAPEEDKSGATWRGLQMGYQHESNGRNGSDERSANITYARTTINIGEPDDWHVILQPQLWVYVFGLVDNMNLYKYRGNSSLLTTVAKGNSASLSLTWLPGEHFAYGSRELDLSIPVQFRDLRTYVLVQYFDGYAETLINYQQHTSAVRAGLQFVR
jgi:outer membrane phospholipase A